MKRLTLGFLMAFAATAEAEMLDWQIDNLKYALDTENKTAALCGVGFSFESSTLDVGEVEDENGQKYTVTSVRAKAFDMCGLLTSVSLPNVTTIGELAFENCFELASVSLPNATMIGEGAFGSCSKLTSVSLPNATTIGEGAFGSCSKLTSVSLPNAMTVGGSAFNSCDSLTSVSLPNVTTIGRGAFTSSPFSGPSLSNLVVSTEAKAEIDKKGRDYYGIPASATIEAVLPEVVVKNAGYEVKEAVVGIEIEPSSVTLKSGEAVLDTELYERSCAFHGITPQPRPETPYTPSADDFKVVSKDAQLVREGEIAVSRESIAAPFAGTVKVEGDKVQLGVAVLKTSDLTAEKKDWGEVVLTASDVKVENGKIVISVPVDSTSGFMILQSCDAKAAQ